MVLLKVLVLTVLAILLAQDMRSRSVQWILFPILITCLIAIKLRNHSPIEIAYSALYSWLFLCIQLAILSVYFSVKQKKWVNISDQLLGLGDILFLMSIAFYLPVLNYMVFYVISLIVILIVWLAWLRIGKSRQDSVPFAGLQAALFAGAFLLSWCIPSFLLTDDDWLIKLLGA